VQISLSNLQIANNRNIPLKKCTWFLRLFLSMMIQESMASA
jgi:TonB dependent receptor.